MSIHVLSIDPVPSRQKGVPVRISELGKHELLIPGQHFLHTLPLEGTRVKQYLAMHPISHSFATRAADCIGHIPSPYVLRRLPDGKNWGVEFEPLEREVPSSTPVKPEAAESTPPTATQRRILDRIIDAILRVN